MLIELTAFALGVSLFLYCLLAGADFGGGILELFLGKTKRAEQRMVISRAIGPVWEANHMWIILAVVILFNGFPKAFSEISIIFHIPLLIMLVGIILKGCAFTFRSYDAVKDDSQKYYTVILIFSSFLTPLMFGAIAGGLFLGRAPLVLGGFYETFVSPWLNLFCLSLGVFVCALFSFLAAVYLVGETTDSSLKILFSKKARIANIVAVVCGGLVWLGAEVAGFPLIHLFLKNILALACLALATLTLIPLWLTLKREDVWWPRVCAGAQILFILLGWFSTQYPAILVRNGGSLTISNSAAPETTLYYLLYALVFGGGLIFPALFYLFKNFKKAR